MELNDIIKLLEAASRLGVFKLEFQGLNVSFHPRAEAATSFPQETQAVTLPNTPIEPMPDDSVMLFASADSTGTPIALEDERAA